MNIITLNMKEISFSKISVDTQIHIIRIGDIIRRKRSELGYTQQTLAFMMLTDKCMISEIERGRYKNITLSTLVKLAYVLDLEVANFF